MLWCRRHDAGVEFTSAVSSMTEDFGDLHISWIVQSSAAIKEGSCAKSKAEWKVPLQCKSAKVLTYGILGNECNATWSDITQTKYNIWWNSGITTSNHCGLCSLQLLNAMYGRQCSTLFGCSYLRQQNSGNKIPPHCCKMWFNTLKEQC